MNKKILCKFNIIIIVSDSPDFWPFNLIIIHIFIAQIRTVITDSMIKYYFTFKRAANDFGVADNTVEIINIEIQ